MRQASACVQVTEASVNVLMLAASHRFRTKSVLLRGVSSLMGVPRRRSQPEQSGSTIQQQRDEGRPAGCDNAVQQVLHQAPAAECVHVVAASHMLRQGRGGDRRRESGCDGTHRGRDRGVQREGAGREGTSTDGVTRPVARGTTGFRASEPLAGACSPASCHPARLPGRC